jgi:hypothetical protein
MYTLAMLITELMKWIEDNGENQGWRFLKELFQTLVMIRDMVVHNMKHTHCGQFLYGYAFWISVTIK